MNRLRKSISYLALVLLLGSVYGFINAAGAIPAAISYPGQVPLEPIVISTGIMLSPAVSLFLTFTEILYPSLALLLGAITSAVHLYFIWHLDFEYTGAKKYAFEFMQVLLGPLPYLVDSLIFSN